MRRRPIVIVVALVALVVLIALVRIGQQHSDCRGPACVSLDNDDKLAHVCLASTGAGPILVARRACVDATHTRIIVVADTIAPTMTNIVSLNGDAWTLETVDALPATSGFSTLVLDFSLFPWPRKNAFHAASYVPRLHGSLALARALGAEWRVVGATTSDTFSQSIFGQFVALALGIVDEQRVHATYGVDATDMLCARRLYVALANSRTAHTYTSIAECNETLPTDAFRTPSLEHPRLHQLAASMYRTCRTAAWAPPCRAFDDASPRVLVLQRLYERRLVNADDVACALEFAGATVRTRSFERLDLCEQLRHVWGASSIVSVHGAGLFAHSFTACRGTGLVMLSHTPCRCNDEDYAHCFPGLKPGRFQVLPSLVVDGTVNALYRACIASHAPARENGPGDVVANTSAVVTAVRCVDEHTSIDGNCVGQYAL